MKVVSNRKETKEDTLFKGRITGQHYIKLKHPTDVYNAFCIEERSVGLCDFCTSYYIPVTSIDILDE